MSTHQAVAANLPATCVVIGASGGIGRAMLRHFSDDENCKRVVAISRSASPQRQPENSALQWFQCDYSEDSMQQIVAAITTMQCDVRKVVICNGILHNEVLQPEKSLEKLDRAALQSVFSANAIVPILWLKALLPELRRSTSCVVSVLSARVGSIGDNSLGGWYSYRASKAALNMLLKTASIEYARRAPGVKIMAFHPGTTDTDLSAPFQKSVPSEKLFTPAFVAQQLSSLMAEAKADGELTFVDWQGETVIW